VFDPQHNFVTSPFFSSAVLASIRGAVALYTFTTLLFTLIWENVSLHDGSGWVLNIFQSYPVISHAFSDTFRILRSSPILGYVHTTGLRSFKR